MTAMVYAHHPLVVALPFFVPALLAVLAIGGVMWRDRHTPDDEREGPAAAGQAVPGKQGEDAPCPTRS
ncbi:MAG: hypothetical protein JWN57_2140 [Frankiales bacterium]|nr:hypothetical protein [Frankiales bacterium]